MQLRLSVIAGPHAGKTFVFDGHDTLLVGRDADAHFRLSHDDPYFSRRHFLMEINPPRCRVLDLNSRNGIRVNGQSTTAAELQDGDEVRAGHTIFKVQLAADGADPGATVDLPSAPTATVAEIASVPGYRFGEKLGAGGMGMVYRATRLADGADVAVKMITPAAGVGPKQVERFLRETRILGALGHRHIVRCEEAGEQEGRLYLVMELVDGPDAGRLLKQRGPFSVAAAVRLMLQVLAGLGHAHTAGFVHRDVKPSNVLIGGPRGGRVGKLADFGLARAFEASQVSGLTLQGEVGGTPAFMAPEQVTHYRDVRPAADQYSAAATLYALLTGRATHDFPKETYRQLVLLMTEEPVPIQDRRSDVPAGLAAVIHKALARDAAARYPSAAEFRAALLPFAGV